MAMADTDILNRLESVLRDRKSAAPDSSYVASLYASGLNKILEKVAEESTELILAAKDRDEAEVVKETADLWFHTMGLLTELGLSSEAVLAELDHRFGTSGIVEKAARTK